MSHAGRTVLLGSVMAMLVACRLSGSVPEPPADCQIPAGTELAYAGTSTLAQLGLDDAGPYRNLIGTAYVTAGPIEAQGFPERLWCIVFDETRAAEALSMSGVAAYGPLDSSWQPRGSRAP